MLKVKKSKIKLVAVLMVLVSLLSIFNVQTVSANTNLNEIIEDIEILEGFANDYILEKNSSYTTNQLVLGYMANDGYNEIWESSGNSKDADFEEYVSSKTTEDLSYLQRALVFDNVDFHLLINSLNVLSKKDSNYCNWGYLLVSATIAHGSTDKNIEDIMNSLYFTDDTSKINAVMDAMNISKIMYSKNISEILESYYKTIKDNTRIRNFTSLTFPTVVINKENLRNNVFNKYTSDSTIITALGNQGIALSNNENLLKAVSYKFADYIYENHPDAVAEVPKDILLTEIKTNEFPEYLNIGDEFEVEVTLVPDNVTNKEYTIVSSDEKVIKVVNNTLVAMNSGECTITIKSSDLEVKKDLKVYGKPSIIKSEKTDYILNIGEEVLLSYEFDVLSNEEVVWECTSSFVSVDEDGNVKAFNAGKASIYCKLKNNPTVFLEYNVVVESPVDSLIITNKANTEKYDDTIILNNKETYFLEISINPTSEKNNLEYKSSNEEVCIVKNGIITAKGPGKATITVVSSVDNQKKDTVNVIVLPPVEKATFSEKEVYINLEKDSEGKFNVEVSFYPEEIDTNLLDFYVYKIDKNGNEKRDFSSITYDYLTGELIAKKIGNYKVVCINRSNYEEVGFFNVTVEFVKEETETTTEEIINKPSDNNGSLGNDFLNSLKTIIIALLVILVISGGTSVVLLIVDYRKQKQRELEEDNELEEELKQTGKKNIKQKPTQPQNKKPSANKIDEEIELDRIIKDISDKFEEEELLIDGVSIDTYMDEYRIDLGEDIINEIKEKENQDIKTEISEINENTEEDNKDN